jgi:hypothetical protein
MSTPPTTLIRRTLKPGDAALDYRFYRFVPHRVKVLDEAEFGDAVWVEVQVECRS